MLQDWIALCLSFYPKYCPALTLICQRLDSPPSPGFLSDVVSGDPNMVDGKFEESPLPFLSRNPGAIFLTGVDVTGTKVYSSISCCG